MIIRLDIAAVGACIALLAGCDSNGQQPARQQQVTVTGTIRDSAGITIVSHDSLGPIERSVVRSPRVTIGTRTGEELSRVIGALRLADGTTVIGNAGSRQLLVFDAAGRLMRRLGGQGQGPGEFADLTWMARHGRDSLVAYDRRQRRLSVFVDTGFIRSFAVQPSGHFSPVAAAPVGVYGDGSSVFAGGGMAMLSDSGPPRIERASEPVVVYDRTGKQGRVIGRFPGAEFAIALTRSGPRRGTAYVRSERVFGHGTAMALVRDLIVIADNAASQFDEFSASGQFIRRVRWRSAKSPVTRMDFDRYVEERLEAIAKPEIRDAARLEFEDASFSPTFPAFAPRLIIDADDNIWIGEFKRLDSQPQRWLIFSIDGGLRGEVVVPGAFQVTDAGNNYAMGVWRDADGVETVRVFDRVTAGR